MRLLNFCIVVLLVLATAYVYDIKFEATMRTTKVAEMRNEARRERDAIAALQAEYARLTSPGRMESLAKRVFSLKQPELSQFDSLEHLPERPSEFIAKPNEMPMVARPEKVEVDLPTGSIAVRGTR
jgi:hypothetical protein